MRRRDFLKASLAAGAALPALPALARADVPTHRWEGHDFGPPPQAKDPLPVGPFGIEQDEGWYTIAAATPATAPVRNYGYGLVGYTWEESGPSLAARRGKETLERHVAKLSALPFVDLLYIRCDWRDVHAAPGKLGLHPIWQLTLDAARARGLRVAFRVMLSNPELQPARVALPDFLLGKVPLVKIGARKGKELQEPRYDHPELQKAFADLVELLAGRFDGDPLIEFVDLMHYGSWGEGHTWNLPSPFSDPAAAERTIVAMTRRQLAAFQKTPLVVNTQPDISRVGNRAVVDLAVRAGAWLRSDSIILDEPEQIEALAHRPPWLAVVMEDGNYRHHSIKKGELPVDAGGVNAIDQRMLHVLDLGGNYWSLWTEADNLARFRRAHPQALETLRRRLGYRVRPAWVWQRKRGGQSEVVIALANDGAAGVPGLLRVSLETPDGRVRVAGALEAGQPLAGRLRLGSFLLPRGLEGQTLRLVAELETRGVRRPVRWACAQPLDDRGGFPIRLKPFTDPDWRKGI